jgi:hypothetical protein
MEMEILIVGLLGGDKNASSHESIRNSLMRSDACSPTAND